MLAWNIINIGLVDSAQNASIDEIVSVQEKSIPKGLLIGNGASTICHWVYAYDAGFVSLDMYMEAPIASLSQLQQKLYMYMSMHTYLHVPLILHYWLFLKVNIISVNYIISMNAQWYRVGRCNYLIYTQII